MKAPQQLAARSVPERSAEDKSSSKKASRAEGGGHTKLPILTRLFGIKPRPTSARARSADSGVCPAVLRMPWAVQPLPHPQAARRSRRRRRRRRRRRYHLSCRGVALVRWLVRATSAAQGPPRPNSPAILAALRYPDQDYRYPYQDYRYPYQDYRYPHQTYRYPHQNYWCPYQDYRYPYQNYRYTLTRFIGTLTRSIK